MRGVERTLVGKGAAKETGQITKFIYNLALFSDADEQ